MMLSTLRADDLGRPTEPGEYKWYDAVVSVGRLHVDKCQEAPETEFRTTLCTKVNDKAMRLVLGACAT